MLDTNMVSYILTGRSGAARGALEGLGANDVACVSAITEAELRYGLVKSVNATKRRPALEWFLARMQVLAWGSEEAQVYGILRAKQEAAGKMLESMDLLIAAHAISAGAILVSRDKVFARVDDLSAVVNWATDL
jgi:tRNA(fMet)-specific endonuclease VapC